MIPLINKRETGVNLRKIMDMRGITAKEVQESPPLELFLETTLETILMEDFL